MHGSGHGRLTLPAMMVFESHCAGSTQPPTATGGPPATAVRWGWWREAGGASAGGRAGRAWAHPALGPSRRVGGDRPRRWEVASRGAVDTRAEDSCTEKAFAQAVKRQGPAWGRNRPVRNRMRRARFRQKQKEELAARDGVRGAVAGLVRAGRYGPTPRYVRSGYSRGIRVGGGVTY